ALRLALSAALAQTNNPAPSSAASAALAQTNTPAPSPAASPPLALTDSGDPAFELQQQDSRSLNHFGLAYRMGLDMNVKFKRLGGFPPKSNPGPATGTGQVHNY